MNRINRQAAAVMCANPVDLYKVMIEDFNYEPVLKHALREHPSRSREEARDALTGFLQWASMIPFSKTSLSMIDSVDWIWHAFILNTRLYRDFCQQFFGRFIDHEPHDEEHEGAMRHYLDHTLVPLQKRYGGSLNHTLLGRRGEMAPICQTHCSHCGTHCGTNCDAGA